MINLLDNDGFHYGKECDLCNSCDEGATCKWTWRSDERVQDAECRCDNRPLLKLWGDLPERAGIEFFAGALYGVSGRRIEKLDQLKACMPQNDGVN